MFCYNCGREIVGDGKFCSSCGTAAVMSDSTTANVKPEPKITYTENAAKDMSADTAASNVQAASSVKATVKVFPINDPVKPEQNVSSADSAANSIPAMGERSQNGIVLKSPKDIKGLKLATAAVPLFVISCLLMLIGWASDASGLLSFALVMVLVTGLVMMYTYFVRYLFLYKKKFAFVPSVDEEMIMDVAAKDIALKYKFKLSIENDLIVFKKGTVKYNLIINDDATFSIIIDSFFRRLMIYAQHKVMKNCGIIAYEIQKAFGITS